MEHRPSHASPQDPELQELLSHSSWIRQLAFATVRDSQLAEDVTQEVLVKALQEQNRSGILLRRWLATVTRRHALNQVRGRQRGQRREQRVARTEGETSATDPDVILAYREVMDALQRMPAKQKEVILLRFHEQMDFRQIGKELGVKEGAARVRLHRALDALRKELGEDRKQWQVHCLILAPGAMRNPAPVLPLPSWPVSLVGLLLVTVVAGLWWWNGESGVPEPTSGQEASLDSAEIPLADESLPPDEGIERSELLAPGQEPTSLPPVDRTLQGRVLRLTEGVAGAEIQIWQPSQKLTVMTQNDGTFSCDLVKGENSVITAISDGHARSKFFPLDSRGPYIVHLPPVMEREGIRIYVHDGVNPKPIAGASVQVYQSPGFTALPLSVQDETIEPMLKLMTDEEGIAVLSGYLQDIPRGLYVEAQGYYSHWEYGGGVGVWSGDEDLHINLEPRENRHLPVQLIDHEGIPLVGLKVRTGFPVSDWENTDSQGFLPTISSWVMAARLIEEGRSSYLPQIISAMLPDGSTWSIRGYDLQNPEVNFLEDRIQIILDLRPITVSLECSSLNEGEWFEAQVDHGDPSWLTNDSWTRLKPGNKSKLRLASRGAIYNLSIRLMPLGIHFPSVRVNGVERDFEISLEVERSVLVLEGQSVDSKSPLTAEVSYGREPSWTAPLLEGRLEIPHSSERRSGSVRILNGKGEPLLLARDVYPVGIALSASLSDPDGVTRLQEVTSESRRVTITIDHEPVLGGTIDRQAIAPDGTVEMSFGENDVPICYFATFQLPASIHEQPGGAILTTFLRSYQSVSPMPGKVEQSADGQWFWNMEMASVELLIPPDPERRKSNVHESICGLNARSQYPYHAQFEDWTWVSAGATGGWLAFRVPAGRYRFNVGEHYFAGEEGVNILPGRINRLKPIDLDEEAAEAEEQ